MKKYILIGCMLAMVFAGAGCSNSHATSSQPQFSDKSAVANQIKITINKDVAKYIGGDHSDGVDGTIVKEVNLIKRSSTEYTGYVVYSWDTTWAVPEGTPHVFQETQGVIDVISDGDTMQFTVMPAGEFTTAQEDLDPNLPPATNIQTVISMLKLDIGKDIHKYVPEYTEGRDSQVHNEGTVDDISLIRRGDGEYTGCVTFKVVVSQGPYAGTTYPKGFIHVYQDGGTQYKIY